METRLKGWPRALWHGLLDVVKRCASWKRSADVARQDSARGVRGWMVLAILLGTMAYAIAEEITLTTYYPSPRGVYKELRVMGPVGIGTMTVAPGAQLDINEPTAANVNVGLLARGGNALNADIFFSVKNSGGADAGASIGSDGALGGGLSLSGNTGGSGNSQVYISTAGNVGIGTTSPTHRLDVTGDIAIHMAPTQGGLYFGDNSPVNQKWQIGYWEPSILPPDGGLVVTETGVADYRMTFLAGGNVGIGTATPTSPAPGPGGTPATGNVDANDVFLRSTGKWVSQGGEPTLSGPFTATKTTWPNLGPHTICMLTQTYFELTPPGGSNNVICNVQRSPAPSFDWQLIASASTSGAQCVAYCLDW